MGKAKSKWGTLGYKHILTTLITEIALLHFRSGSHKLKYASHARKFC